MFFGEDIILGKIKGSSKRGGPNRIWTDGIKAATGMSLQELSWAVRTGHWDNHLFIESPGLGADSKAHTEHMHGKNRCTLAAREPDPTHR